jgi:hypothetical protein
VLRRLAQRRSALGNPIVVLIIARLHGNPGRRDPRVSKLQSYNKSKGNSGTLQKIMAQQNTSEN